MAARGSAVQGRPNAARPAFFGDIEGGSALLVARDRRQSEGRLAGDVDRTLNAERQPLLHAGHDMMLAPEFERTIVLDQPGEPPIERARSGRQYQHLMGACPERFLDKRRLSPDAHDHGGHQRERPRVRPAHGSDQLRAGQRLHGGGGNNHVRNALGHGVDGFGRALIGLDPAGADGGEHGPHQRQDRPAIVDDGDNQRLELAAEGAMVQHWVTWSSRSNASVVNGS